MKKICTKLKETFYFRKSEKKMPYDECLTMLKNLKDINTSVLNKDNNESMIEESFYLLGIKERCLEIEILIEAKVEDDYIIDLDVDYNPIERMLDVISENIAYNKIANRSEFVGFDEQNNKLKFRFEGKELSFNKDSIELNFNKPYYQALKNFCSIASSIDGLEYQRTIDDKPQPSIDLKILDINEISKAETMDAKNEVKEDMQMMQGKVIMIRPVLRKDKRFKWTIAFDPLLPDNLVLQGTHDYDAYVKDDEFIEWSASSNNHGYKNGDSFVCDITYSVHHKTGDIFAIIKDVVLRNVKKT